MEEFTLVILKPDGVKKNLLNVVLERFNDEGLNVSNLKTMDLSKELVRKHYAHLLTRNFYQELEDFMLSGPVVVMIVNGENAVHRVREIVGATDSRKALPNTIRGMYGTDACRNIIHASDSNENALIETMRFYQEEIERVDKNGYSYQKRR